jgi:hypothetical protein
MGMSERKKTEEEEEGGLPVKCRVGKCVCWSAIER